MSYSASKATDRLHFLRLAELLLELLAIGDVESHADGAHNFAIGIAQRLDVAGVGGSLPLHVESNGFAGYGPAMSGNREKRLVGGLEIFEKGHAHDLIGLEAQPRQSRSERGGEAKVGVDGPQHGGKLLDQDAQSRFAFVHFYFGALAFDGEGDLIADRGEKFQITFGVGFGAIVVLHDEHTNGSSRCAQRDAQPGGRGRTTGPNLSVLR